MMMTGDENKVVLGFFNLTNDFVSTSVVFLQVFVHFADLQSRQIWKKNQPRIFVMQ